MADPVWSIRCPRCALLRPHPWTGRARVNANKAKLDAWLLFRCEGCGRVHKHRVFRRESVAGVALSVLDALHSNDPEGLRPLLPAGAVTSWSVEGPIVDRPTTVVLSVPSGLRIRLDRVFARGLGCPRGAVAAWLPEARLSRPVRDGQRVMVVPPGG